MDKITKRIDNLEEILASSLLIFTTFLVFIQVVLRYMFNYSLYWSEELSRMLIVWFIFLGSSMAVRDKAHVNMDALANIIPKAIKDIIDIIINLICIVFCVLVVYGGFKILSTALRLNLMATSVKLPLFVPYAAVPVGMIFMMFRYIGDTMKSIRLVFKKGETEKGENI